MALTFVRAGILNGSGLSVDYTSLLNWLDGQIAGVEKSKFNIDNGVIIKITAIETLKSLKHGLIEARDSVNI